MSRYTRITLDADALAHNFQVLKHHVPPTTKIMAAVKANGYGHESVWVAQVLIEQGVDALAVCSIEEAIELRSYGCPDTDIVLLEGVFDAAELDVVMQQNLTIVVHDEIQIYYLKNKKIEDNINVIAKVDTGMGRLGFFPDEIEKTLDALESIEEVTVIAIATHFANADVPENPLNAQQLAVFDTINTGLPRTAANSGAILSNPDSYYDWVRPGIALYGASPLTGVSAKTLNLQAVMTFEAEIISIKQHKAGDCIGYGSTFVCEQDSTVAVVSAGYGDGYPRHVPNGTPVWVNGQRAPLAGRVSMDMITIDISEIDAKIGDKVELWGENLPVDEIAQCVDTIAYTLFCGITDRVERIEKGEPAYGES